jgi:hypothetical protein
MTGLGRSLPRAEGNAAVEMTGSGRSLLQAEGNPPVEMTGLGRSLLHAEGNAAVEMTGLGGSLLQTEGNPSVEMTGFVGRSWCWTAGVRRAVWFLWRSGSPTDGDGEKTWGLQKREIRSRARTAETNVISGVGPCQASKNGVGMAVFGGLGGRESFC